MFSNVKRSVGFLDYRLFSLHLIVEVFECITYFLHRLSFHSEKKYFQYLKIILVFIREHITLSQNMLRNLKVSFFKCFFEQILQLVVFLIWHQFQQFKPNGNAVDGNATKLLLNLRF